MTHQCATSSFQFNCSIEQFLNPILKKFDNDKRELRVCFFDEDNLGRF